jgi:hypothetical protein
MRSRTAACAAAPSPLASNGTLCRASTSRAIVPSTTCASRLTFARCWSVVTTTMETSASTNAAAITHVEEARAAAVVLKCTLSASTGGAEGMKIACQRLDGHRRAQAEGAASR